MKHKNFTAKLTVMAMVVSILSSAAVAADTENVYENGNYPENMVYFVDCNDSDTTLFNSVKENQPYLRNYVNDQVFNETDGWGIASKIGEDYDSPAAGNMTAGDMYKTGWYLKGGKTLEYKFTLSAGEYSVYTGMGEFWPSNSVRNMTVNVLDKDGTNIGTSTAVLNGSEGVLETKTASEITLSTSQTITVQIAKESGSDPVLSWIGISAAQEPKTVDQWYKTADKFTGENGDYGIVWNKAENDSKYGSWTNNGGIVTISSAQGASANDVCYGVTASVKNIKPDTKYVISFEEKTAISTCANEQHGFYVNTDTISRKNTENDPQKCNVADVRRNGTAARFHNSECNDTGWEIQTFEWTSGNGLKNGDDNLGASFVFILRSSIGSVKIRNLRIYEYSDTVLPPAINPSERAGFNANVIITDGSAAISADTGEEGDLITVTVPNDYVENSLVVSYMSGSNSILAELTKVNDKTYTFEMPSADVSVSCLTNKSENKHIIVGTTDSYYVKNDNPLNVIFDVPDEIGNIKNCIISVPVRKNGGNAKNMTAVMNDVTFEVNFGKVLGKAAGTAITKGASNVLTITNENSAGVDYYFDDNSGHAPVSASNLATLTLYIENKNGYDNILTIAKDKGADIQKGMYGLFFEDINYAADGGLYAEQIENRSFEAIKCKNNGDKTYDTSYDGLYQWTSDNGTMTLKDEDGLNENNPHYMRFTGVSFENGAYEGVYTERGKKYTVSFWAKSDSFDGAISVSAGNNSVRVTDNITSEWKKYTATLTADEDTRYEKFVVELSKSGTVDFDMISMIPEDAIFGALRPDLVDMLKDLHPGFLRFPGGCIVEGNSIDNRYDWKKSVGSVEERVQNWNRWAVKSPKTRLDEGYSHYNQTLGLGYFEYFELCEYLECEPLPVVGVGIACQYDTNVAIEQYPMDSDEFKQCIQDALDLIDFANSIDFENNEWARLRRDMGHEEPFNLKMIGVGNEQWEASDSQFFDRYEAFEKAIHDKMPEMKIIGTCGPDAVDGGKANEWREAWSWAREKSQTNPDFAYAMDEHYYRTPDWFLTKNDFYDDYDRNVKVFAGEYASRWANDSSRSDINTLETAISIASFMTGLERNADVVYMASYAPLFARLGYMQWSPDMIWFDDAKCYGSPEYYVQAMFAENLGDYTVESKIDGADCIVNEIYQTVSYDDGDKTMIIKLVNNSEETKHIKLNIAQDWDIDMSNTLSTVLTAQTIGAYNTIDNSEKVAPVTRLIDLSDGVYTLEAQSVTVIRIPSSESVENNVINNIVKEDGILNSVTLNIPKNVISAKLYIAQYNENDTLNRADVVQAVNGTVVLDIPIVTSKVKLMLWEDNSNPVMKVVEVK